MSESLTIVQRVDWSKLPADTRVDPGLSRYASESQDHVVMPAAQAFAAITGIRGNNAQTKINLPRESLFPYWQDDYVSADRPRSSSHQDDIRSATIGYGLATSTGYVVGTFATFAAAVAAQAAYAAKQAGEPAPADVAAAQIKAIKSELAVLGKSPRSVLPGDRRYTAGKGKPLVTAAALVSESASDV